MSSSSAVAVAFEVSAKPSSHWIVEPAKSGRAACKGCKMKLAMSELRMGHCNFNTETDSYWTRWYHLQCAKVKDSVDTSEIEGYEDLTAEEQDTVKNNVFPSRRAAKKETRLAELRERKRKRGSGGGGGGGSPSSKAKVSASSAAAAAIPTVATVVLTPSLATTTTTTMTASSTSLATALAAAQAMLVRELKSELKQRSLSTSGKKALLLATLSAALVTELGDAKLTEAIAEAKSLRVVDLKAALAEYGLKGMKGKKAVLLAALIEAITEEHIGAVAESESESESEEEESEEEESEEEESEEESESDEAAGTSDDVDLTNAEESELALLENENKYSSMKVRELKDLLRQNNQLLGGNKPELAARCADAALYGALPYCPECTHYKPTERSGGIPVRHGGRTSVVYASGDHGHGGQGAWQCSGWFDVERGFFVRCTFTATHVDRVPWVEVV